MKIIKRNVNITKTDIAWSAVFAGLIASIMIFSIKMIPDIIAFVSESQDKSVSTSDVAENYMQDLFEKKVEGRDKLESNVTIEEKSEKVQFGLKVNEEASSLIFSVRSPEGFEYNTWNKMIPEFVTIDEHSEGFYVITVDWKKARMTEGVYTITAYGKGVDEFIAVVI